MRTRHFGPTLAAASCIVLTLSASDQRLSQAQPSAADALVEGLASYFGRQLIGRQMASGERYDAAAMIAAHPTYPFGTSLRVTNLANGRSVKVRVADRGPAPGPRRRGVIIDLSRAAAEALDMIASGRVRVRLEVLPRDDRRMGR